MSFLHKEEEEEKKVFLNLTQKFLFNFVSGLLVETRFIGSSSAIVDLWFDYLQQ